MPIDAVVQRTREQKVRKRFFLKKRSKNFCMEVAG
jgi:hypothetical protein